MKIKVNIVGINMPLYTYIFLPKTQLIRRNNTIEKIRQLNNMLLSMNSG
jgi:hypothetical protein